MPPTTSHSWSNRNAASPQGVDRIRGDQWHLTFLRIAEAHRIAQGEGVTVAVPDTGVHPHPDLARNLRRGTDIVAGGSGDGRQDRNSHGTGMAGLIAAHGRAGKQGALGIAPKARILPIRVKINDQGGTTHHLADAIKYAITQNVNVISISAAGAADSRLQTAIEAAIRADIVVVAAAGNKPLSQHVGYPASYPGAIAVGGVDRLGQRASVSVTGPEIDVVAPAVDIFSTSIDGKYRKGTGTSDSAAIVAGAAALIRSKYPYLPASEVAHRLTATAIDKGPPGRDDEYGYGVIDLVAALTADVPPLGFGSATAGAPDHTASTTTTAAEPADDGESGTTARGLVTLGVIVAACGAWALIARRRRHGNDPPPRISR
nr:type VII secretion-associated serine protease mycosin [Micromonospora peucetia]